MNGLVLNRLMIGHKRARPGRRLPGPGLFLFWGPLLECPADGTSSLLLALATCPEDRSGARSQAPKKETNRPLRRLRLVDVSRNRSEGGGERGVGVSLSG